LADHILTTMCASWRNSSSIPVTATHSLFISFAPNG
jgi:hypothetical protein